MFLRRSYKFGALIYFAIKIMYRENTTGDTTEVKKNKEKFEVFNDWSIEQGDYVRRNLSQQDKYYRKKPNTWVIVLIALLGAAAILLGFILHSKF